MGHIELRDLSDVESAPAPVLGGALADWIAGHGDDPETRRWAVTDDGAVVGAAVTFAAGGEREAAYRLDVDDPETASETLRLLVSLEPERPLYARVPADDEASAAMLARLGFTELDRSATEVRLFLPPTLE